MKKMFAAVLLASVAVVACHSKKPTTGPATQDKAPIERKDDDDATGGAAYGGHKADAPPVKSSPDPAPR